MSDENVINKGNISDLLSEIDLLLDGLDKLNILITSAQITKTIFVSGIQSILNEKINFIHTLGCEYSYIDEKEIDRAIFLSQNPNNIIVVKEPAVNLIGTLTSIIKQKEAGANIEIVNREIDCINIARDNPNKNVILFSCGFEPINPNVAGLITIAKQESIKNLYVLLSNKLLPAAVKNLLNSQYKIDGYLVPGDIAIIIGMKAWRFVSDEYKIPASICGFEPFDILCSLKSLITQILNGESLLVNNYSKLVHNESNPLAQEKTFDVLIPKSAVWNAYGVIPFSGLTFSSEFVDFDANNLSEFIPFDKQETKCIASKILTYKNLPTDCKLYKTCCTPQNPVNTCMAVENGLCYLFYSIDQSLIPKLDAPII